MSYGTFDEVRSRPEPGRFFLLDDADRDPIAPRRSDSDRPGIALPICTVRYIGRFLATTRWTCRGQWAYLAEQPGIEDASCVKRYTERRPTAYEYAVGPGHIASTKSALDNRRRIPPTQSQGGRCAWGKRGEGRARFR
ncbi:DUF4158 domain-containing protein [Kitasatospora sp. NPDC093550]|uniref:DUF4158 domain-containing protein n=1 Tax=Kitasatospora sp. NPDC093550 TaxID=3364089 RepID=UPI0038023349